MSEQWLGSPIAIETRKKLEVFNDPKFIFEPVEHVYTYDGKVIIGATTYLKRFSEEFDAMYWSEKNAAKEKCTPEELRQRWDDKRDRACILGTLVHEGIERWWLEQPEPESFDFPEDIVGEADERIKMFYDFAEKRMGTLEPVAIEQRVFNVEWGLAGTLDALFLVGDKLIVGDWKTNSKFKTNKDFAFKKMHAPFDDLKDNEFNKYSIQLSLYRLMMEEVGIVTDSAFLCHIPSGGPVAIHKTTDLTARLRRYLGGNTGKLFDPQPLFS